MNFLRKKLQQKERTSKIQGKLVIRVGTAAKILVLKFLFST